jgi:uncharacterized protein (TIGR00266 family)
MERRETMERKDVMEKYRMFVADYNKGADRTDLCARYRLREQDFEPFLAFLKKKGFVLSPVNQGQFMSAHEIDFEIHGDDLQFVEIELDPGETAVAEAGAMMYMDSGIGMQTIFGDGSRESAGIMDKLFGAGKRILTGESLFMTTFTNIGSGKKRVAFGAPYPGKIIPVDLSETGRELICQKDAFLCAAKGVSIGIAFQKKMGVGLFGGEGFILERLQGDGYVFIHAGGTIIEKELQPHETLKIDTGCIAAMQSGVSYDIEFVGGLKSALFGGEGLFFANLTGPGKVWLQSLPFSRLADRIIASAPRAGGTRKGEDSILGSLGDFIDGDNSF